jgi:hypothetical protein
VLLVVNRDALAGASDVLYIQALPWAVLVVFVVGMVVTAVLRTRAPQRYAQIGQFEVADIDAPVGGQA